ncbi:hypothetical protein [Agriterribacter sp.]|uniref:hypothetical protein n=1 Tax=Agriterribacter sp. TaxID=2821509 RepID=UPI002C720732|nr:hypothetical protein [Agriterribacter sp.]HRO47728.1 hypothetical protein [Agriterribacter sp.]HRQ17209.1 hypothetical protein [Agriterribacter sp.]
MQSQLSLFVVSSPRTIIISPPGDNNEWCATITFTLQSPGGDNKQVPGEDA